MKDDELIHEFTRVRVTPQRVFVEVRVADIAQEGFLSQRWTLAAMLPPKTPAIAIDRALLRVLADYRYFRTCELCAERRHVGEFALEAARAGRDHCIECVGP